jgi:putative transcriptional regulator
LTDKNSLHIYAAMKNVLRTFREQRGWSQGALAEMLGVSRQTINAVETDKYDPSLPLALRLARLFGVNPQDIFIDDWTPDGRAENAP